MISNLITTKRWDILTKAVEVAEATIMVVDVAVEEAVATEVAVDVEGVTTPTLTPTKGRQEINSPSKPQGQSNTSKYLPKVVPKVHLKEGFNTSTRALKEEHPCRAVSLSRWPAEPKAALMAARPAP